MRPPFYKTFLLLPSIASFAQIALSACADAGDVNPRVGLIWFVGLALLFLGWGLLMKRRVKEQTKELDRSEERYRRIVETANEGIWEIDASRITIFVNENMARILGYAPEEMIGRPIESFMAEDELSDHEYRMEKRFKGKSEIYERRYVHKNGGVVHVHVSAKPIMDDVGNVIGSFGMASDITERKKAEEAVRASEELLRLIFMNSPDSSTIARLADGVLVDVNDGFVRLSGYSREEVIGKSVREVGLWNSEDDWRNQRDLLAECGSYDNVQGTFRRKDGSVSQGLISAKVIELYGEPHVISTTRDLTDRIQTEEALRESEERLRQIFMTSPDSNVINRLEDGKITDVNEGFTRGAGFSREEAIGRSPMELGLWHKEEQNLELNNELREKGFYENKVVEFRRKDGRVVTSLISARVMELSGVPHIISSARDISARLQAEEAVRESEERLREIFLSGPDSSSIVRLRDNRFVDVNEAFSYFTGYGREEVAGRTLQEVGIWYSEEEWQKQRILLVENGSYKNLQAAFRKKDGGQRIGLVSARIITLYGEPHIVSSTRDLTDRIQAEEALRESEERLRRIFMTSPDASSISALHGGLYIDINEGFVKLSGYTRDEVIGKTLNDLGIWPSEEDNLLLREILLDKGVVQNLRTEFRKKDGSTVHGLMSASLITLNGMPHVIAITKDIGDIIRAEQEKEQLQEQLQQARKMEAVGTLAGGIAHDFNNMLQVINGYTQLLLLNKTGDDPESQRLMAIEQTSTRAADLVHQLLLFSRKAETNRSLLDINREVEQAQRILERTIPKMVDIEVHLGSRLWEVNADPVQMEQIMLNLGINASDAMPDGGKLIFETQNIHLDDEYARTHIKAEPGRYVLLTVSDTGHGMSKETVEKIFEPFFTTKEIGKGTGLGLASVYGIVRSHGGLIYCYSEIGRGTTFKIYLPAADVKDDVERQPPDVELMSGKGSETIMLVDDEEMIREFGSEALEQFGYKVLIASSGEEALDIYRKKGADIDLVVMDIGMPGMGGHRCMQELIKLNPDVRVIIASGYSTDGQVKHSMESGASDYVPKPYKIDNLLEKVRFVLDKNH